jgi:hypothetical protein
MQLVAVIHGFGGWNFAGDIIMNHINDFLLIKLDLLPSKHPNIYAVSDCNNIILFTFSSLTSRRPMTASTTKRYGEHW